jgi:hypothetical protein
MLEDLSLSWFFFSSIPKHTRSAMTKFIGKSRRTLPMLAKITVKNFSPRRRALVDDKTAGAAAEGRGAATTRNMVPCPPRPSASGLLSFFSSLLSFRFLLARVNQSSNHPRGTCLRASCLLLVEEPRETNTRAQKRHSNDAQTFNGPNSQMFFSC